VRAERVGDGDYHSMEDRFRAQHLYKAAVVRTRPRQAIRRMNHQHVDASRIAYSHDSHSGSKYSNDGNNSNMITQEYPSQPPPPRSHRATEVGFGEYKQWRVPKTRGHTPGNPA
jgi:hypothetical protein